MPGRPRANRWSTKKPATTLPAGLVPDEDDLQSRINSYCTRVGLWWWRDTASNRLAALGDKRRNKKGFLDCFIVGGWVMFREVKTDTGTVTEEQKKLILLLEKAGADVGVWREADWQSGKIYSELDACAKAMKRRPDGQIVLPDMGKFLYLLTDTSSAAAVHWDAGSKHVDRVTWRGHGADLMTLVANAVPHTPEQVAAWLGRHELPETATPAQVLAALQGDLMRTGSEARNVAA